MRSIINQLVVLLAICAIGAGCDLNNKECRTDSDCPAGNVCDTPTNRCQDAPYDAGFDAGGRDGNEDGSQDAGDGNLLDGNDGGIEDGANDGDGTSGDLLADGGEEDGDNNQNHPPQITSSPPETATENVESVYNISCDDPDSDSLTLEIGPQDTCEGALEENAGTSAIYKFTPDEQMGGASCNIEINCSDSMADDNQIEEVEIVEDNQAPEITNLPSDISVIWSQFGTFQSEGHDPDVPEDILRWRIIDSNCSFTNAIDEQSGLVEWTCGGIESCEISVILTDDGINGENQLSDTDYLSIECINSPPAFTSTPRSEVAEGAVYDYEIQCVDADSDEITLEIGPSDNCGGTLNDNGDGTGTYSFHAPYVTISEVDCNLEILCSDTISLASQSATVSIMICPPGFAASDCGTRCVWYVDNSVQTSGTGQSWEEAFKTIQEGIDAAFLNVENLGTCEVWIRQGVYYIFNNEPQDNIDLKRGVELFGGFPSQGSDYEDRDWELYETVIDGRDGPEDNGRVYHVIEAEDGSMLDGITVAHGQAYGDAFMGWHRGGGVATANDALFHAKNCLFLENSASRYGGAIHSQGGATLGIQNCRFFGNRGGAISSYKTEALDSIFVANSGSSFGALKGAYLVRNCVFVNNNASHGGAINSSEGVIENTVFFGNSGERGGAIYGGDVQVKNCHFTGNNASGMGGAYYQHADSSGRIESCAFLGNRAGYGGGAIANNFNDTPTADLSVVNSTILFNFQDESVGGGGYGGGGVFTNEGTTNLVNCILWFNDPLEITDHFGGQTNIAYSNIRWGYEGAGNIEEDSMIAGLPLDTGTWTSVEHDGDAYSSTFVDIEANWIDGELAGLYLKPDVDDYRFLFILDNTENSISTWGEHYWVEVADPYEIYDVSLQPNSHCVDAGDGTVAPEYDINGNPRIDVMDSEPQNSGIGPPWVDMGAFEIQE